MSAIFLNNTQYAGGGGGSSSLPSGGTTGQVLAKHSNTDGDVEWVTPSGGSGHTIQNSSGTNMTSRDTLQFLGATVSDDSTNEKTVVTIDLSNYYTKAETTTQINNAIGAALLASY